MRLIFDRDAIDDLKGLHKGEARKILGKIEQFAEHPKSLANNVKALRGTRIKRLRIGNYRVMFVIEDEDMIVTAIKHRREAYR